MENCKQTAEKCKQIFENRKKLPPLKHILDLPTLGQICIVSEQQPFISDFFQTEHLYLVTFLINNNWEVVFHLVTLETYITRLKTLMYVLHAVSELRS